VLRAGKETSLRGILAEPGDDGSLLEDPREPTARPGSRAPHVVLDRDGGFVSTINLFGSGFVLFAGPYGGAWAAAGAAVAGRLGVRLTPYVLGEELKDPDGSFARAYGLSDGGPRWSGPTGTSPSGRVGRPATRRSSWRTS
jgi:putative polyketide hydroxylase